MGRARMWVAAGRLAGRKAPRRAGGRQRAASFRAKRMRALSTMPSWQRCMRCADSAAERRQYAAAIRASITPYASSRRRLPSGAAGAQLLSQRTAQSAISDAREALKPALSAVSGPPRRHLAPWHAAGPFRAPECAAARAHDHLQQDAVEEHLARVKADEEQQTQAGCALRSSQATAPRSISAGQPPRQQQHRSAPTLGLEGRDRPAAGRRSRRRTGRRGIGGGRTGAAAGQTAGQVDSVRPDAVVSRHRGAPAAASSRERGQRRLRRPPQPQPSSPACSPSTTCHALAQRAGSCCASGQSGRGRPNSPCAFGLAGTAHFLRGFARKSRGRRPPQRFPHGERERVRGPRGRLPGVSEHSGPRLCWTRWMAPHAFGLHDGECRRGIRRRRRWRRGGGR